MAAEAPPFLRTLDENELSGVLAAATADNAVEEQLEEMEATKTRRPTSAAPRSGAPRSLTSSRTSSARAIGIAV